MSNVNFVKASDFHSSPRAGVGIRKYFTSEIIVPDSENEKDGRIVKLKNSTRGVDRIGDTIKSSGWKLNHYLAAPTILFAHDLNRPPIAKSLSTWVADDALWSNAQFMDNSIDTSGFSDMIYRMVTNGFLKGVSVGFKPLKWKVAKGDAKRRNGIDFLEQELLEISIVPVPMHPEALVQAKSMGIDVAPLADHLEEALDNWKESSGRILVPKNKVEKAVSALKGTRSYHPGPDTQDQLLLSNLKAVKDRAMEDLIAKFLNGESITFNVDDPVKLEFENKLMEMGENGDEAVKGLLVHQTISDNGQEITLSHTKEEKAAVSIFESAIPWDMAHAEGTEASNSGQSAYPNSINASPDDPELISRSAFVSKDDHKFRLIHHDENGSVSKSGLIMAMAQLCGNVISEEDQIPEADRQECYNHLARHYTEDFFMEPPAFDMVANQSLFAQEALVTINTETGEIGLRVEPEDPDQEEEDKDPDYDEASEEDAKDKEEEDIKASEEEQDEHKVEFETTEDEAIIWSDRAQLKKQFVRKSIGDRLPIISSRLYNTPLLIHPPKLSAIMVGLANHFDLSAEALDKIFAAAGVPTKKQMESEKIYRVTAEGVATIPVRGTLVHDSAWMDNYSGMTSYSTLTKKFTEAIDDRDVRAIALLMDSGGGEVSGCFDFVDLIYENRGEKPIWAFVDESAYSAAYAIASAADFIVAPRTAGVGSIGVVAMHVDHSGMLAMNGLDPTFIFAGRKKVDGNPWEPLGEEATKDIQSEIDELYALFVSTVARNRGLSEDAVRATEAGTYLAPEGLGIGLVDGVGSVRSGYADLIAQLDSLGIPTEIDSLAYEVTEKVGDLSITYRAPTREAVFSLMSEYHENGKVSSKTGTITVVDEKAVSENTTDIVSDIKSEVEEQEKPSSIKSLEEQIKQILLRPDMKNAIKETIREQVNKERGIIPDRPR